MLIKKILSYRLIILYSLIIILVIEVFYINNLVKKTNYELVVTTNSEDEILNTIKHMSLEEKIAQMLIVYYEADNYDDNVKNFMEQIKPGGFIISKGNFSTFDNTKKYIQDLKQHSKIPLIISIDEEGGLVQRLKYLIDIKPTDIPSMYELGDTNNPSLAYEVGKVIAEEVRTLGINVVYAPVIDVYSNLDNKVIGDRSFSSDPNQVSIMANALAKGLEDNGVIATYKHFPGHGDTIIDSHDDLPLIEKDYMALMKLELIPFKEAIKNDAKIIMIGHLALPSVTGSNIPATLSKRIVDILKQDLNYHGLVITDALNMGALTNYYDDSKICLEAVKSGADLLLMPNNISGCLNAIKENISEERINASVLKILHFKYKYLKKDNTLGKQYLGSRKHQDIIERIK